jgi:hypothetical protein
MSFHPAQFKVVHEDRKRPNNSFVGVRRNGAGSPHFVLPPGFDSFPVSDPEAVSKYFFGLFRALRLFRDFYRRDDSFAESDFGGEGGIQIDVKRSEPAMLYSKIQVLEEVIDRFDELRIHNVLYRNRRTEEVDYSQIHRYLDQAIYQNDIPYVEEMRLPKPAIELDTTALVRMFCFIYVEIASRIGTDISPEVEAEAARFKSRRLSPDSVLFQAVETHNRTVDQLKRILDEIDREVAHKGADYWYFFEAVETFLYGRLDENSEGISWGITQFAYVWEDMCMMWMRENRWDDVLYADTRRYSNSYVGGHKLYIHDDFESPFAVELGGHKRYMRPDVVLADEQSPLDLLQVSSQGGAINKVKVPRHVRSRSPDEAKELLERVKRKIGRDKVTERTKGQKWSYKFFGTNKKRMEATLKGMSSEGDSKYYVVDFKCMPSYSYKEGRLKGKARSDERKQITYEHALQLNGYGHTRSQLCLPKYYEESLAGISRSIKSGDLNQKLADEEIEVLEVDFDQVLSLYLDQHN